MAITVRGFIKMSEYIGQALKKVRIDAKKTQADMGEALGVSQAQVSKLESGASEVTVFQLFKWSFACNVSFETVSIKIQQKMIWR